MCPSLKHRVSLFSRPPCAGRSAPTRFSAPPPHSLTLPFFAFAYLSRRPGTLLSIPQAAMCWEDGALMVRKTRMASVIDMIPDTDRQTGAKSSERNAKGAIIETATLPCRHANAARRVKTTLRKRIPGWMRVAGRGQMGQRLRGTVRMYVLHSMWDTIR